MEWTIRDIIIIAITSSTLIVSVVMRWNDMKHLEKNVNRLVKKFDRMEDRMTRHAERISRVEGVISEK